MRKSKIVNSYFKDSLAAPFNVNKVTQEAELNQHVANNGHPSSIVSHFMKTFLSFVEVYKIRS